MAQNLWALGSVISVVFRCIFVDEGVVGTLAVAGSVEDPSAYISVNTARSIMQLGFLEPFSIRAAHLTLQLPGCPARKLQCIDLWNIYTILYQIMNNHEEPFKMYQNVTRI